MSLVASLRRINRNEFTEADVKALLIDARDKGIGRAVKEIGDLVAHSERDQGMSQNHVALMFGRFSIMATYQLGKKPFPIDGTCDWWLKQYVLGQLSLVGRRILREKLGGDFKKLRREVTSYFPEGDFPTTMARPVDRRFELILNTMIRLLKVNHVAALQSDVVRQEFSALISRYGIEPSRINHLIACAATLFHGATFKMPGGEVVSSTLVVIERPPETYEIEGQQYAKITRHGGIRVCVEVPVLHKDRTIGMVFELFDTTLQSDEWIQDNLYKTDVDGLPHYELGEHLSFDSRQTRPIGPA